MMPPYLPRVPSGVWCQRSLGEVAGGLCQGRRAPGGLPEEKASLQQAAAEPRGPRAGWC